MLGVNATALPDLGMAQADGLYFQAEELSNPYGDPPEWDLIVYQPCQRCGGLTMESYQIDSLASLGACLEKWRTYPVPVVCHSCYDSETPESLPESECDIPTPASKPDPFGQLIDLIGAALRDHGWIE